MKKRVASTSAVNPTQQLGEASVGGVAFKLYNGISTTYRRVAEAPVKDLQIAYAALTGDERTGIPVEHLIAVVSGAVQEEWYKKSNKELPDRVKKAQEERLKAARAATPQERVKREKPPAPPRPPKEPKAPREQNGSNSTAGLKPAIRALLAEGKTDDEIYALLKPKYARLKPRDILWSRENPKQNGGGK